MSGVDDIAGLIAGWQDAQRRFWSAASGKAAFADAGAFAPPDWQAFDGAILQLIDALPENGDDNSDPALTGQAFAAAASYRDVIARTWTRIRWSPLRRVTSRWVWRTTLWWWGTCFRSNLENRPQTAAAHRSDSWRR